MSDDAEDLLRADQRGLWCAAGDFHIDPWKPVPLAVITHAHSDHSRPGSERYIAAEPSVPLMQRRLGADADIVGMPYRQPFQLGSATVSLHPAGHVYGSAQVRVEVDGQIWVASGDYKRTPDPTCEPFEIVPCDGFISESTFGLPIFRWPDTAHTVAQLIAWWQRNASGARASVVTCYVLGKAQRLMAEIGRQLPHLEQPTLYLHGALLGMTSLYRDAEIDLPPTCAVADAPAEVVRDRFAGQLILAPPSAAGSPWMRRFRKPRVGFVSGWMTSRPQRKRRGIDHGFVLSDHADWPGLIDTIEATGARSVRTTHGYSDALARWLREQRGLDASPLDTRYGDDEGLP